MIALSRRHFVQGAGMAGLGLLAACGRWPGQGQESTKVARLGWLSLVSASTSTPYLEAVGEGLRDLGYIEDQNILFEYRYADGDASRLTGLAAELAQLPVDVLLAPGASAAAAREASKTIPIVMVAYSEDPVARGLIASLARPGANVTGLTSFIAQLTEKRLDLLSQTLPGLSRVAILGPPLGSREVQQAEAATRALGMQALPLDVHSAEDLAQAFEVASLQRAEAVFLGGWAVTSLHRAQAIMLAAQHGLPAMYPQSEFAREGGLMSYATNLSAQARRAAYYVDRILKGTHPADLPVEQPTTFDFVINLKTAQPLGLTIPQHVLLQATEVIQ
jgi:putative ABC transport system substrate-binding protein